MENSIKIGQTDLLEKIRIGIMILTGPAAFYLCFNGYLDYQPEAGKWNAAYHALQLFILHAPHYDRPLPRELEIGRWLASITTIMAVINIVLYVFWYQIMVIFLRWLKNHTILCGLGEIGLAVAKNFAKKKKLVVIEKNIDNENLSMLKKLGVKVLKGNALDPVVLNKVHISKAKHLYALTGNDFDNLTIVKNQLKLVEDNELKGCELKISANIDSINLKTAIRFESASAEKKCELIDLLNAFYESANKKSQVNNKSDKKFINEQFNTCKDKLLDYNPEKSPDYIELSQKVILFDINELCARYVFHKFPPDRFKPVTDKNAPPIRIHFLGFSQTGEELLKLCIQNCHYINRKNTIITLINGDIDEIENKIKNKFPDIGKVVKLIPVKMNPLYLTHQFINKPNIDGEKLDNPDLIYICAGEDHFQASYSIIAREIFGDKVPIVRWLTKDVMLHFNQFHDENIHTIDIMNTIVRDEIITNSNVDKKAIAIHHRWIKRDIRNYIDKVENEIKDNKEISKQKKTLVPWHLLPEEIRDDNRSAVEHNLIKVRSSKEISKKIDFDNPENDVVDFSIIKTKTEEINENDLVWQLAEMEHRRFMATKYYYGWKINDENTKERDDKKKIRPDLKEFIQLEKDTQDYDIEQIREMEDIWLIGSSKTDSSKDQPKNKITWVKTVSEFIKTLWYNIRKKGKENL